MLGMIAFAATVSAVTSGQSTGSTAASSSRPFTGLGWQAMPNRWWSARFARVNGFARESPPTSARR